MGGTKFARIVFGLAGVWGVLVLTPFYWMADAIGRLYPPPITHPDFYYGFLAITMAWQAAFLIIATDPVRFRPIMIAAMLEKFAFVCTMIVLYAAGSVTLGQLAKTSPDLVLGLLFVGAYAVTGRREATGRQLQSRQTAAPDVSPPFTTS